MKTLFIFFLFFIIIQPTIAQKMLPPGMVYVPNTVLKYDYVKELSRDKRVGRFYTARYVETNFQYKQYLDYLEKHGMDSLLQLAQPNKNVFDNIPLSATDLECLKQLYWTGKTFEDYPVIGLDYHQIAAYLQWKTDRLNLASLLESGDIAEDSVADDMFQTKDFAKGEKDKYKNYRLYMGYWLPDIHTTVSALEMTSKPFRKMKPDRDFLSWLKKQERFRFLLYDPSEQDSKNIYKDEVFRELGIRPAVKSDLFDALKKDKYKKLPELVFDEAWMDSLANNGGYILVNNEQEKPQYINNEKMNPKNYPVMTSDPKKKMILTWAANKGRLENVFKSTAGENPLFAFRTCIRILR